MKTGFYFFTPKCDYFFVCDDVVRRPGRVRQIDDILKSKFNCKYRGMSGLWPLKELLWPATIEKKNLKGRNYYDIKGISSAFSSGSFEYEKPTEIITL